MSRFRLRQTKFLGVGPATQRVHSFPSLCRFLPVPSMPCPVRVVQCTCARRTRTVSSGITGREKGRMSLHLGLEFECATEYVLHTSKLRKKKSCFGYKWWSLHQVRRFPPIRIAKIGQKRTKKKERRKNQKKCRPSEFRVNDVPTIFWFQKYLQKKKEERK